MPNFEHTPANDPASVQIRDAATVMILRDEPGFQVLMVQRAARAVFAPQAWVFPGGRVDAADHDPTQPQGARDDDDDLPWRHAAVRETHEEASLVLRPDGLYDVGRFVTPVGPPRRYDTRFYVAAAPVGCEAVPDGVEVVNAQWIAPQEAIDRSRDAAFPLMGVTQRMLACLARYSAVADVLAVGASVPEPRQVRVKDPAGQYEVLLPEDEGYETAELHVEHGWVRF